MSSNNKEKMLHPYFTTVFVDTVKSLMVSPPNTFGHSGSWDTIEFPEGYEKPEKDLFNETFKRNFIEKGFEILRNKRNKLLTDSDWTDQYEIEGWKEYRQSLRDLPSTTEDPENPVWPEPPKVKITTTASTTRTQLEENLQTTRTELVETKADLSDTKTELKADFSETRTELKADLQTIQTQLNTHTHPLEEHTHQDLVDQLTTEKVKTYELQKKVELLEMSHASLIQRIEALEKL